jgi:hypothetical protein
MTDYNDALREPLFRAMIGAGVVDGTFFAASDGTDGEIVSVGIWFPPGKVMMES